MFCAMKNESQRSVRCQFIRSFLFVSFESLFIDEVTSHKIQEISDVRKCLLMHRSRIRLETCMFPVMSHRLRNSVLIELFLRASDARTLQELVSPFLTEASIRSKYANVVLMLKKRERKKERNEMFTSDQRSCDSFRANSNVQEYAFRLRIALIGAPRRCHVNRQE